jgi:hypothetical protein
VTVLDLGACFCGQPATRTLAAVPYCDPCAEVVLAPIRERHPSTGGYGRQIGPLREDWGNNYAELECDDCGATWVGPIGEVCGHCVERLDEPRRERLRLAPPPNLNGDHGANQAPISKEPGDWQRHDLVELGRQIVAGNYTPETAQYLLVEGGQPLLYPGRVHSIFGEPGGGKTWIALYAIAERLQADQPVLLIDWEDSPQGTTTRLLQLGCTPDQLTLLDYRNPISGLWQGWPAIDVDTAAWVLVVIDSTGEAMAAAGIKSNDDTPVAEWMALAKRLARTGASVLLLDHVPKNVDNRDMEIGSQRKQAAITGASYRCDTVTSPAKGRDGLLKLIVRKDRLGNRSKGSTAAEVHIDEAHGPLRIELRISEAQAATERGERFRPTILMEKVSRWLEFHPGASRRTIEKEVTGNGPAIRAAIDILLEEGHIAVSKVGQTHEHSIVKPYSEAFDGLLQAVDNPVSPQPRPTASIPRPTASMDAACTTASTASPSVYQDGTRDAVGDLFSTVTASTVDKSKPTRRPVDLDEEF